jgi:hypothetical protein
LGKQVIDKVGDVIPAMTGAGMRPAMVRPSPPVASGVSAVPAAIPAVSGNGAATGTEQPAPENNVQGWIVFEIGALKDKAKKGKDPGFWVDYILENEEEPGCAAIMFAIRQGATFEQLLAIDPEIAQNPQLTFWFRQVYDGLHGDMDTGGESGNIGNPVPDAPASHPGQPGTSSPGPRKAVS